MRKLLTFAGIFLLLLVGAGCGQKTSSQGTQNDTAPVAANPSLATFDSSFGYTMAYDPYLFYVLTDSSSDSFDLIDENSEETPPVYVAVQRLSGYTVKEYTEILENQSSTGVYSVTESNFGADQREAVTVTYEEDTAEGVAYYTEIIVKVDSDLLYIEVATYQGMEARINTAIEKMLETFSVED